MLAPIVNSQPCYINLTNKAKSDINEIFGSKEEVLDIETGDIVNHILSAQDFFLVHIERTVGKTVEDIYVNIHFDTSENKEISKYIANHTFSLYGVIKEDGILIIGASLLHFGIGQANNRRLTSFMHFFINERNGTALPEDTLIAINRLPFGRERSRFIKSRLESWEVYLDMVMVKEAQNELKIDFHSARLTEHLREVNIFCPNLRLHVAGKDLRSAAVSLFWEEQGKEQMDEKIGTVRRFDFDKNIVEIELEKDYEELARKNKWTPVIAGKVHISNHGGLVQARRLRKGFNDLQNGMAVNPNLEYLIFDENPIMDTSNNAYNFEFKEAIQDDLNDFQRDAVKGALAAEDIYLIQGPPGTGKTTVIAEICYQNAERGLKTLVASQSNLAVDNALSKLLAHPKIRILRKGRTNSIEIEGQQFIEENVAETWKKQTLESIQIDINEIDNVIETRNKEIKKNERLLSKNLKKLSDIENAPKVKLALMDLENKMYSAMGQIVRLKNIKENYEIEKAEIKQKLQCNVHDLAKLESLLDDWEESNIYNDKKSGLQKQIERLHAEIELFEAEKDFMKATESHALMNKKLVYLNQRKNKIISDLENISKMKGAEIVSFVEYRKDEIPSEILHGQIQLTRTLRLIDTGEAGSRKILSNNDTLLELEKQLAFIMDRQKSVLNEYGNDTELIETLEGARNYNLSELEKVVITLANQRIAFTPPSFIQKLKWKATKKLPKQVRNQIEEFTQAVGANKQLKEILRNNEMEMLEIKEAETKLPFLITQLREMLNEFYKQVVKDLAKDIAITDSDVLSSERVKKRCENLYSELKVKLGSSELKNKNLDLNLILSDAEETLKELGSEENFKEKLLLEKKDKELSVENYRIRLNTLENDIQNLDVELGELEKVLEVQAKQVDKDRKRINELETIDLKKEKITLTEKNKMINLTITSLNEGMKSYLDDKEMKNEWCEMLKDAKEYDLREIKKLYIKHANVIGVTCVQSAKKDFAEDYPDFDVVIIDEVSKATPPELLLPMLKGKKVILVGDQHQLPPLIGQETLEEVTDKILNPQRKEEIRGNIEESLFERLFSSLPDQYKSTLRIQYRMHEDIMETITQFYEGESKTGIGLECGLTNSNKARDHNIDGQYIKRGQHIMWFDLPHEEEFFETKEKGMTSPFNNAELKIIYELLIDMDNAIEKAKEEGRISQETKKSIGIISFYGEQVRKLRYLVEDMNLKHLEFRIGTVDRFQGMESEIIIASFVRNHSKKEEDIGFANDYRRLNVALSRAKELLIVTGSSKMFTEQAKRASSRKMYTRVIEIVRFKNGLRDHKGRVK